jgi:hypothetical protein
MANKSTITIIGTQPREYDKRTHIDINNNNNKQNKKKEYDSRICKCGYENPEKAYCLTNFSNHLASPYCITEYCAKPDNDNDPCCDIFMTCIFCPIKFALTWPCCIGSIINDCINKCKHTDNNYLC